MSDIIFIKMKKLKSLIFKKLVLEGLNKKDANIVSDVLVYTDAKGIYSHGTIRIEHYINRIKHGGINLNQKLKFEIKGKNAALVDVHGSMGHVGMHFATKNTIKKVRSKGIFVTSIRNASHCGALSYYTTMMLKEKLISMIVVNTDKALAPFGSKEAFLGTNPIAFGFPGNNNNIIIDMATSLVSLGKVLEAREKNQTIPETWGIDKEGNPTTDPFNLYTLSPMAGYKGSALAMAVEGFTGLFSSAYGPYITRMYKDLDKYRNVAGFIFAMHPDIFGDKENYFKNTDNMFNDIKKLNIIQGVKDIYIPGEQGNMRYKESLENGVKVLKSVYKFLKS